MRFYEGRHPFYCGVDLHARKMYVSLVDEAGTLVEQQNLDAGPEPFLALIRQYRERLVVGCECMFAWYCRRSVSATTAFAACRSGGSLRVQSSSYLTR